MEDAVVLRAEEEIADLLREMKEKEDQIEIIPKGSKVYEN